MTSFSIPGPAYDPTHEEIAALYEDGVDVNRFDDEAKDLVSLSTKRTIGNLFPSRSGETGVGGWISEFGDHTISVETINDFGIDEQKAISVTVKKNDPVIVRIGDGKKLSGDFSDKTFVFGAYARSERSAEMNAVLVCWLASGEVKYSTKVWNSGFDGGKRVRARLKAPKGTIAVRAGFVLSGDSVSDMKWVLTDIEGFPEIPAPAYHARDQGGDILLSRHGRLGRSAEQDTAAWLSAFSEIGEIGGGRIMLPAQKIEIGSCANLNNDFGEGSGTGISITGAGRGATTLINLGASGLMNWTQSAARDVTFTAKDFHVLTAANGDNGTLFKVGSVPGGNHHHRDFVARDISIIPNNKAADYVTRAFHLAGIHRPLFDNVTAANPFGPGVNTIQQHQGIAVFDLADCYSPHFEKCYAWGGAIGFNQVSTINPGAEAGTFVDCVADAGIGFNIETVGIEPGGYARGCHVNYAIAGFKVKNRKAFKIVDALIYNEEPGAGRDIDLIDCTGVFIDGLRSNFDDINDSRHGVYMNSGCSKITVSYGEFSGGGVGIEIEAGANDVRLHNNKFSPDLSGKIVDNGALALTVKHDKSLNVLASNTGPYTVLNDVDATVVFDTENRDVGGWGLAGSGTFTVPSGLGIRKIKVRANVVWQNNGSGFREAKITINGARVVGSGHIRRDSEGPSQMALETASLDVKDGDVVRLVVRQNSGSQLNIIGDVATWIEIEAEDG